MTVIIISALAMTQIAATQFALTQTAMIEIAKWDSFYVIVGSAAGALIGLQFVVLTLIAERPPTGLAEAGAAFGSPTIVHFGAVLFLSALLHAPWQTITIAAILWGPLGLRWSCVLSDRLPAHAEASRIPAGFRRLALSRGPASVCLRDPRVVVIRGGGPRARSLVRCRRRGAVVALHRHPQRLGQRRLPRTREHRWRKHQTSSRRERIAKEAN